MCFPAAFSPARSKAWVGAYRRARSIPETGLPKISEPMGLVRNPQRFAVRVES